MGGLCFEAEPFERGNQCVLIQRPVVPNSDPFRGEIDARCLYPLDIPQASLDLADATGAAHARYGEAAVCELGAISCI
ncbi:hypothetical protein GCM10011411_24950 [Aurantiacibacter arachoides]|nr:hypothetical protein GCM10011411_24950 [Aurantiacibacter arachoides]